MGVWAVSMVKNEQDVIEDAVRHLLAEGVEHVIVADNCSTDRTRAILDRLARTNPVTVVLDSEPAFLQAEKMTRLLHMARERGATWVVPFDADELWIGIGGRLAEVIEASDDADVLVGDWLDHYPVPFSPRSGFARMPIRRRAPEHYRKVAVRCLPDVAIVPGNHGVEGQEGLRCVEERIVVHHYRYRSFRHYVRKARNGKAAVEAAGGRLEAHYCSHWRRDGSLPMWRLFARWCGMYYRAARAGLCLDRTLPSG